MLRTLFACALLFLSSVIYAETLIIEPDMGREPILNQIKQAHSAVQIVMYGFTDPEIMHALIDAKVAGKSVQTLLEESPYRNESENIIAKHTLEAANINLKWANPEFKLTHQKTILIDNHTAMIMTFNLTKSSFKNERNFALLIDDPDMVKEIESAFNADWQRQPFTPHNPNLVWSPNNSRDKTVELINQAQSNIKIYAQSITDYKTIGALTKASHQGIHVDIITSKQPDRNMKKLEYLTKAGATIHYNNHLYIHAKVIIIDDKQAMLGSMNLTKPSIDDNRELSVITRNPQIIRQLNNTFTQDKSPSDHHFDENVLVKQLTRIGMKELKKFMAL